MPNYDVYCPECKVEFEEFNVPVDSKDEIPCYMCNGETVTLITQRGFQFLNGYDEHLNAFITGPEHKRQIMKEKGLEEVHSAEIPRINNMSVKKKDDKGMEKAVDSLHKKGKFDPNWAKFV